MYRETCSAIAKAGISAFLDFYRPANKHKKCYGGWCARKIFI